MQFVGDFLRKHPLLVALLTAAVLPYVIGLGDSSIWDANEAFYAETPREMIESGDYINPSFNYYPRFNKPVLSYWAVAASYHAFGVSEFSERIPIALSALVLIASAVWLGRLAGSYDAGLVAGLILATAPRFLMFSRRIIIDMWITMFMVLTLLFFALAELSAEPRTPNPESRNPNPQFPTPNPRKKWLVLMYVAAGLGVLTKGPVAVVLPGLAFLIYLALERRLGDLRRLMIPSGVVIVAAIVLPWYLALYAQHGWVHIKEFFIDENLMRYAQPVGTPRRGIWFYIPVLLTDLFPWSILLPAAVVSASAAFARRKAAASAEDRVQRLLLVWIATIVLFFTFSRTKQDLYIFSVVPAVAALVAGLLVRAFHGQPNTLVRSRVSLGIASAVLGILGVALLAFVVVPERYPLAGSLLISLLAIGGGGLATILTLRGRVKHGTIALASALVAMGWVFVLVTLPDFERYKPVAPLVHLIKQRATAESRIGYYRIALPSMAFYMRRQVFEAYDLDVLKQMFASGQEVYCLMTYEDYQSVKGVLSGPTHVLASRPLFDVKIQSFLEGTELPDIVLVSNRP
jgi:4-amino-4-deoxy-L-arabinose transferase-like glycosyltransferase